MLRRFYTVLISLFALSNICIAADSYSYPELNVTPLSSTRLKIEASREKRRGFFRHPAIQFSSLVTILSGIAMLDKGNNESEIKNGETSNPNIISTLVGVTVGATWMLLPQLLGKKKFAKAYRNIYKLPANTKRQKLIKERLAEEELRNIRGFSKRMRYLSAATNIGALAYMFGNAESGTLASPMLIASMVLATLPIFLPCPWKKPADQQDIYKKKIYGPIASATLLLDPKSKKLVPGILLGLRF